MDAVVPFDASGLAQVIERARMLFDDGDVASARMLASGAYDQAKAAGSYATRFHAGEHLITKARRLQADALIIEARAKITIATEWSAAQESGEASKGGRPKKTVPSENGFTAAEAGLTRREIHEARKLADAERRDPGIVERAIAGRVAAGLEPSRANLRVAIGTDSASGAERGNNLYETCPEAMHTLLALETFGGRIKEPACGRGAISRMLEAAGYDVVLSDLVDYGTHDRHGVLQTVQDFVTSEAGDDCDDIATNPPYGSALNAFVAHALRVHRPPKMALLLNLNFLCGFDDPDRNYAMDECMPARVHVFSRRLPMMHRDGWDGNEANSRMNTAWFVWEQNLVGEYAGPTVINRVDWKDYQPGAAA
ncbi:SAM-dependent methyltransferase [Mesorhizobium sp. M7A.F.Ca.MR.245.00.0.0]|uniref:SAM-dependent methyltransferase n=1 Tax=Mesorhizobium sp. M7A.F.Ca.MR.245.00.0.0 TaxID=2496778 RepID=UPI000FCA94EA|nr:SAM-dependent methyltransferase [Mesorhizobium sp. M7A.F.Ca.MR.245.00.0.0]RUV19920.1 SAM-dependent methyltransferase [Mesorhizobium sp. M7A.F.Ca.MR.245.00.0.0]RUV51486.1 SAM-dependent methyltransferase [Mesorhizobium sp. M7A.F.Ca.MR.228.00.0.0]